MTRQGKLSRRCAAMIQENPSYTLADVKAVIRAWYEERAQGVTDRQAMELSLIARRQLGLPSINPSNVRKVRCSTSLVQRCRALVTGNPEFTLDDVIALMREWDSEHGRTREPARLRRRAQQLVLLARQELYVQQRQLKRTL